MRSQVAMLVACCGAMLASTRAVLTPAMFRARVPLVRMELEAAVVGTPEAMIASTADAAVAMPFATDSFVETAQTTYESADVTPAILDVAASTAVFPAEAPVVDAPPDATMLMVAVAAGIPLLGLFVTQLVLVFSGGAQEKSQNTLSEPLRKVPSPLELSGGRTSSKLPGEPRDAPTIFFEGVENLKADPTGWLFPAHEAKKPSSAAEAFTVASKQSFPVVAPEPFPVAAPQPIPSAQPLPVAPVMESPPSESVVAAAQLSAVQQRSLQQAETSRSAPEIFLSGLENLAEDPTGWFYGAPSMLYGNLPPPPPPPVQMPVVRRSRGISSTPAGSSRKDYKDRKSVV